MPDEAREIVFPHGVPVTMLDRKSGEAPASSESAPSESLNQELDAVSTKAESGLSSEAGVIEEQARQVQPLKDGENLLRRAPNPSTPKNQQHAPKS